MKKYVARILVLVLVFSMAGCSSTTPPATTATTTAAATPGTTATAVPETVEFPKFLTVGGGSTGGVFFSAAAGIAQMITNNTGCTATAQTTTGGGQNILLMHDGEMELAIADNYVVQQAYNGEGDFAGLKHENLRAIGMVYTSYFQQAVTNASGIKSLKDVAGKTMVVGGPSSGTEIANFSVFAAHGMDYHADKNLLQAEWLGVSSGIELIQNGQADGISSISPPPFSSFVELFMTVPCQLISLDDDAIENLTAGDSPYQKGVIPAGTYEGQKEDVNTIYMSVLLVCDESLDDDVVYEITKMMYEKKDYLISQHTCFNEVNLEIGSHGITIPLHPGAERYYSEQNVLE